MLSEKIINAAPTDGLWNDNRSDEEQIGATYDELEKAMQNVAESNSDLSDREIEVVTTLKSINFSNRHKMIPIPVCEIPRSYI